MLDADVDVNTQGGEYGNALQAVVYQKNREIVEMLLDSGTKVNAQGGYFGNALQAAGNNNSRFAAREEIAKVLLDGGADDTYQDGIQDRSLESTDWAETLFWLLED